MKVEAEPGVDTPAIDPERSEDSAAGVRTLGVDARVRRENRIGEMSSTCPDGDAFHHTPEGSTVKIPWTAGLERGSSRDQVTSSANGDIA